MTISCDVLVVGGGLAGLFAAAVADEQLKIVLLCKTTIEGSCSYLAQGGVAATADGVDKETHIADTLRAGCGLCDEKAVRVLVENAWDCIVLLEKMGICFDKDVSEYARTLEGGHTTPRILHVGGDATGRGIIEALYSFIKTKDNVEIITDVFCAELLVDEGICRGAIFGDGKKMDTCEAKAVLLATGGMGQVYGDTTNPAGSTADGIGLAYRAGAKITGMEFIQFHPTVFQITDGGSRFLISEAVRGEGGILLNSLGERFMEQYDIRLELAPRDVVARAVVKEIKRTGAQCVYLDLSHIDKDVIEKRFPTIKKKCMEAGIDISQEKIPVSCAQHYCMGGVDTDTDGRTSIGCLYACGEVAKTGVHGANRLASNSLLEAMVFGRRCMIAIMGKITGNKDNSADYSFDVKYNENIAIVDSCLQMDDNYAVKIAVIQSIMRNCFSVERNSVDMALGLEQLKKIMDEFKEEAARRSVDFKCHEYLNIVQTALLIATQSIERKASVGAHYLTCKGE